MWDRLHATEGSCATIAWLTVGRQWRARELKLKSNSDLEKLWVVLLIERNMLYTTKDMHKRQKTKMPFPNRLRKVRKSMALIKLVLHNRAIEERRAQLEKEADELTPHPTEEQSQGDKEK